MKYGLITIHNTQNYGSLLQTFSTYKAFKSLNIDIDLIDYHNDVIDSRELPITQVRIKSIKDIIKRVIWGKAQEKKYNSMYIFLKNNTSLSRVFNKENIREANSQYDAFITGSDIVWGTTITGSDMTYFLDFASENKKKISFSSSIGTKWDQKEQKIIKPLLQRYDNITVREQLAADWIEELTEKKVPVTCDPTILWEPQFWADFVLENYVLIYAVNPDKKNIVDGIEYAKKHGKVAYFINFYSPVRGTKTIRPINVEQWITLFAKADAVFSASYHGLLFSLYFKRKVFFYNRGEKSRMISLSKELNIEKREGIGDNIEKDYPIDYDFVHKKLAEKRQFSWQCMKNMLNIE